MATRQDLYEKRQTGFFRDAQGHRSSKRLIGTILIGAGGAFLGIVGVFSLFNPVADPQTSLDVGRTLIYAGAGLLGVGVVEKFGSKNGGGK